MSSRHEDVSIEQPPSGDQGGNVDFLMDENILTNESREDEDNESQATPSGGPTSKGINQIN